MVCYEWSKTRSTSCTNWIFPVTFTKACPVTIQNNIHWWWIEIKEIPKYKLYGNIVDFLKTTFWYHNNDTKRNPWVMLCSYCPIMTQPAIYTLPFTLQFWYKLLCILERVTKSRKVYISSHDGLQKLHNINFTWHRSRGFLRDRVKNQEFPPLPATFLKTIQNPFPRIWESIYHIKWEAGKKFGFLYGDTLWTFLL